MRIAPLNVSQQPNFKGILKQANRFEYDEFSQETTVTEITYSYYPFADESYAEMEKVSSKYHKDEYIARPYPEWNTCTISRVHVKKPLTITKAQYEALKEKNITDNFILKTFA